MIRYVVRVLRRLVQRKGHTAVAPYDWARAIALASAVGDLPPQYAAAVRLASLASAGDGSPIAERAALNRSLFALLLRESYPLLPYLELTVCKYKGLDPWLTRGAPPRRTSLFRGTVGIGSATGRSVWVHFVQAEALDDAWLRALYAGIHFYLDRRHELDIHGESMAYYWSEHTACGLN